MNISKEQLVCHLMQDVNRNGAILLFLTENDPDEIIQIGQSFLIRYQQDIFVSSQSPVELEQICAILTDEDRFISSIETWMIPYLKRGYQAVWESTLPRYILPIDVPLPEPVTPVRALPPEFASLVSINWAHGSNDDDSRSYIKSRLERGLSAAVFIQEEPVAWVATHDDGSLGFAYVLEKYRHRGFARDATIFLIQQQRRLGLPSIVNIAKDNHASIALAIKLGFILAGETTWISLDVTEGNK